jgi:cell wall-associated NlpC family hydrolase
MPPHRLSTLLSNLISPKFRHGSKLLILAAVVTLAGCAITNENDGYGSHASRDSYLSQTKADPLGAYLSSNQFSGYSSSQYPNATLSTRGLASTALNFLGTKYKYGGETPYTGFDCSGLVAYAVEKSLGLKLPRTSAEIAQEGKSIKQSELKKGDLVFFNTLGRRFSHVGIYLGNKQFVHAPRAGAVVRVENMDISYWKKRYNGARRLDVSSPADTLAMK